jgi:hypothetical protein
MSSSPHSSGFVVRTWTGAVWPLLAAFAAVFGLLVAWQAVGPAPVLMTFVTLSLFALTLAWSMSGGSLTRNRAVLAGVGVPLFMLVVMGWCQTAGAYGLLPPLSLALTSPTVLALAPQAGRAAARRRGARRYRSQRVLMDREMVDRRFEEIVRQLDGSGEARDG